MAFLTSPFWLQTLDAINRNPCQRHLHLKRLFFSIWIWAEAHFLESSSFIYCSAHDLIWNMQICSDTFLHSETNQWPKHWVKRWAKLWSVTCSRWISRNQWNIICTQKINRNLCSKFTNSWMQQLLLTRKHSVFPHASQTWNCAGPTAGAPALQRPQELGHWLCRQNLRFKLPSETAFGSDGPGQMTGRGYRAWTWTQTSWIWTLPPDQQCSLRVTSVQLLYWRSLGLSDSVSHGGPVRIRFSRWIQAPAAESESLAVKFTLNIVSNLSMIIRWSWWN